MITIDELVERVHARRFRFSSEAELQEGIGRVLWGIDAPLEREWDLGRQYGRPDFVVGWTAVEIKVGGSLAELTRQVHRYAQHPGINSILVVTTRSRHRNLPDTINGKPCRVCYLNPLA